MRYILLTLIITITWSCNQDVKKTFQQALMEGDFQTLEQILNEGSIQDTMLINGKTPLSIAVEQSNLDVIELLLSHGVDVNRKNRDGSTAIHLATSEAIIKYLHSKGAITNDYICNCGTSCKVLVLQKDSRRAKVQILSPCERNLNYAESLYANNAKTSKLPSPPSPPKAGEHRIKQWIYEAELKEYEKKVAATRKAAGEQKRKFLTQFKSFTAGQQIWLNTALINNQNPDCNQLDKSINVWQWQEEAVSASSGAMGTGSGFLVSPDGIVATNAHVVQNAQRVEVIFFDDNSATTYKAEIARQDDANDVALLRIVDQKFKRLDDLPYTIAVDTRIAEKAFTLGYPKPGLFGKNFKYTSGEISALSGIHDQVNALQHTVAIQPGNSGGPLFNDEGNVIGLTSGAPNKEGAGIPVEGVFYAVKADYLLALYRSLPSKAELPRQSSLKNMERTDQVDKLRNYICMIVAYF